MPTLVNREPLVTGWQFLPPTRKVFRETVRKPGQVYKYAGLPETAKRPSREKGMPETAQDTPFTADSALYGLESSSHPSQWESVGLRRL
jgi:hypothetical protein